MEREGRKEKWREEEEGRRLKEMGKTGTDEGEKRKKRREREGGWALRGRKEGKEKGLWTEMNGLGKLRLG